MFAAQLLITLLLFAALPLLRERKPEIVTGDGESLRHAGVDFVSDAQPDLNPWNF